MPAHRSRIRHILAPGTRVVRRGRGAWQVGIDPGRRVVVPDSPEIAAELDGLRLGTPGADEATGLTRSLGDAGLLARPPRTLRVVLAGSRDAELTGLLATFGVRVDRAATPGLPGLLVATGEPRRELLDPWLREGRRHIVVRVVDGRIVVGPLVVPGRTACLRCLDCHLVDIEPEHYAVLHRYAHTPREDGHGDRLPAVTRHLAVAWALHDLAAHLDGQTPVTLSSTLALGESGLECTSWHRHPECACAWSGTIEA
jgi:hypothetical protein